MRDAEARETCVKPGVLVIHNRYRQAGGEDTMVRAEVALLRQRGHRVLEYARNNAEIDEFGPSAQGCAAAERDVEPASLCRTAAVDSSWSARMWCTAITCCR